MPNPSTGRPRRRLLIVLGAAVLALASISTARARSAPDAAAYRIADMRAMLFNANDGTFSRDVLAPPRPALWNVVIGEGDAEGPSSSALVVVEVAGEPGSYEDARQVELTARTEEGVLLRRASSLSVLNARGRTFVGFWLDDVGCQPVRLQARLLGQPQPSTRTDEIDFQCGE